MSNKSVEQLEALDQFAPETPHREALIEKDLPAAAPIARTSGPAAFLGWALAMCVHPIAAWRRLSRGGRSLVLAVYGLVGYMMGTLLLLNWP
jgi:hypothetical protein